MEKRSSKDIAVLSLKKFTIFHVLFNSMSMCHTDFYGCDKLLFYMVNLMQVLFRWNTGCFSFFYSLFFMFC